MAKKQTKTSDTVRVSEPSFIGIQSELSDPNESMMESSKQDTTDSFQPTTCVQSDSLSQNIVQEAAVLELPNDIYHSIQYPGYATIAEKILITLGGMPAVQKAFTEQAGFLELNYTPDNLFAHPISGDVIPTANLLLKVVKRTNRKTGETTMEHHIAGLVSKTCRFRGMADFQYEVDPDDPLVKLRYKMETLDVKTLDELPFNMEKKSNGPPLHHIPPPMFSRIQWPLEYKYQQNPASIKKRTANVRTVHGKFKLKPGLLVYDFSTPNVPNEPPENHDAAKELIDMLRELFAQRPIWSRAAIMATINSPLTRQKPLTDALSMVAYYTITGPWRSLWIRLGYDPRKERSSRLYQTADLRSRKNSHIRAKRLPQSYDDTTVNLEPVKAQEEKSVKSYIFDGVTKVNFGIFQLCDVTDPSLKTMITSAKYCRSEYDERDGWYVADHQRLIRIAISRKLWTLHGMTRVSSKIPGQEGARRNRNKELRAINRKMSTDMDTFDPSVNSGLESSVDIDTCDVSSAESTESTAMMPHETHLVEPTFSNSVKSKVDAIMKNLQLTQNNNCEVSSSDRSVDVSTQELPRIEQFSRDTHTSMQDDDESIDESEDMDEEDIEDIEVISDKEDYFDILEED
ncbi:tau 95 subunit of transcription factor TFIIIC [Batrachochytrium dendrobatidis]